MTDTAVRVQTGGGPAAGELTLQRAGPGDLEALSRFEPGNGALTGAQLAECIEYGGVLYYEDDHGPLALVCWRETARGWELSPVLIRRDASDDGYGRWLLTHVEALAIKHSIPRLSLEALPTTGADYYRRLGYEPEYPGARRLTRQVGGTWQLKQAVS